MEDDSAEIEKLEEKLAQLKKTLYRKQIQIDFYNKMIEIASEEVGFDIRAKYGQSQDTDSK